MRVFWIQRIALMVMAASAVALSGAESTRAQFAPYGQPAASEQANYGYGNQSQYSGQTQASYGYMNPTQPQQSNGYAGQQPYQAQPAVPAYNPQRQMPAQQAQPRYAGYSMPPQASQQPQYTAMSYAAMEHHGESAAPAMESAPAPVPAEDAAAACPTGDCQSPAPSYQGGYMGCDGGCYNSYNTFDSGCGFGYGAAGCCNRGCGCGGRSCLSGCGCGCRPRWFGGVYGLLMERDRGPYVPLAFSTPTPAFGYYPADGEVNLRLNDADIDFQPGLEFRLGMYCGGGGCNPCGCGCGPTYGIEGVYWGLFEEDATSAVSDTTVDANRLYSMIDFRGLEYDPGTGYRPVNDYYDYAPPTADHTTPTDVELRSLSVRSTFRMQNAELNLLRLPILCGGCGAYGGGCGMGGCGAGGCDSACGGCDSACGNGCGACGCMPRYSVTTVLGARFMRLDDDFWFRSDYEDDPGGTPVLGWLAYNSEVDNTLYGAQMGCRGTYRLGCSGCFALHCASTLGIFGNHIEVTQWMDSPSGTVRYANNGNDDFYVEGEKDDVSFLGEFRLGASYQYNCNCRVYGGWRVIGITGVALPTDQIQNAFNSPAQTAWIHSNGSMLIHGLQAGVEYNY